VAGNTAARGFDGQREPTSNEVATEVPPDAAKGGKNFRATIPVYFHVVHDGPVANLTQKQIDDQIRVMSFGFAGLETHEAGHLAQPVPRLPGRVQQLGRLRR